MREAIRQKLITSIPEVAGRVFEPHAAGADTQKPYLVVLMGTDTEDTPWTGYRQIVEVWPYLDQTQFADVDAISEKIAAALGSLPLTTAAGEVFSCQYLGAAGPDVFDQEWGIITRGLRFAVLALQPVAVVETMAGDPWIEALAGWTESILSTLTTTFAESWAIYRNAWPAGYRKPAVLWRLTDFETQEKSRAVYEVRKRIVGHVLGSSPNEQINVALQIVQEMRSAIKLLLDAANKRYMMVASAAADLKANALTAGQISLTLSRLTVRPETEAPLMAGVHHADNLKP